MSGKKSQSSPGFPVLAALLIVAGVLLLLRNFDALPPGMWRAMGKLWPVLLLILGVHIFLRSRPWLAGFVVLLVLLAGIGMAWWLSSSYPSSFAVQLP